MRVTARQAVDAARKAGRICLAVNVEDCNAAEAVTQAFEEANAPGILQVTPTTFAFVGWRYLPHHLLRIAEEAQVPMAVQFDHVRAWADVERGLEAGFSGLMYDGSAADWDENVRITRQAVELAHAQGVSCEGEIGHVTRPGDPAGQRLTSPEEAEEFARLTGVDLLAVSVGTRHGQSPGDGSVDVTRLSEITRSVAIPLVLHGGSGLSSDQIRPLSRLGLGKWNVGEAVKRGILKALAPCAEDRAPREPLSRAYAAAMAETERRLRWTVGDGGPSVMAKAERNRP